MIPTEHQDMTLEKGSHKWNYELDVIRTTYGITHPGDDFVRMFANRRVTAEQKVWYVQRALMLQGDSRR